jgi:hypothetical protein
MSRVVTHRLYLRLPQQWRVAPYHSCSNEGTNVYGISHIGDVLSREPASGCSNAHVGGP